MKYSAIVVFVMLVLTIIPISVSSDSSDDLWIEYPSEVINGDSFSMNIYLDPDINISAWVTDYLTYDSDVLNATKVELSNFWNGTAFKSTGFINNDLGKHNESQAFRQIGSDENKSLFKIYFDAIQAGVTNIECFVSYGDGTSSYSDTISFTLTVEATVGDFIATATTDKSIELSWSNIPGFDKTVITVNESGTSNGYMSEQTEIYNGTGTWINYTSELTPATPYYFTAWGWNETYQVFTNYSVHDWEVTKSNFTLELLSPFNYLTSKNRTKRNFNGVNYHYDGYAGWNKYLKCTIRWFNDTGKNPSWQLYSDNSLISSSHASGLHMSGTVNVDLYPPYAKERIALSQGNKNVNWTFNITDGYTYKFYEVGYHTYELVHSGEWGGTEDSRYDINNDGSEVNVNDLLQTWTNRWSIGDGEHDYWKLYDVNNDGNVSVIDLSEIWSHRTCGGFSPTNTSNKAMIYVDDNYDSNTIGWKVDHFNNITEAVENVKLGGTVKVYPGTYTEKQIIVDKNITIIGSGKDKTFAIGSGTRSLFWIAEDDVSIRGFNLSNPTTNNVACIWVIGENATIRDCHCRNSHAGVYFKAQRFSSVINNTMDSLTYGIYTLTSNHIFNENTIRNCSRGIKLRFCKNNLVAYNVIKNCDGRAIVCGDGTEFNIISNNTFINNNLSSSQVSTSDHVYDESPDDIFYHNYYDDYIGTGVYSWYTHSNYNEDINPRASP